MRSYPALLAGNYEQDREFRRRMHQWLGDIWRDKDEQLAMRYGADVD